MSFQHLRRTVIILFLFAPQLLLAQKKGQALIDSLIQKIPAVADTNKVIAYNKIAFEYLRLQRNEEVAQYANLTIKLSKELNYKRGILTGNANMGNAYRSKDPKLAESFYLTALEIAKELKIADSENRLYYYLAFVCVSQYKTDESIVYAKRALAYYEKQNNKQMIGELKNWLAEADAMQGNPSSLLTNDLGKLKNYSKTDGSDEHINLLNRISQNYLALNNIPKSLDYLQDALEIKGIKNPETLFEINSQAGGIYSAIDDHKRALDYLLKALAYLKTSKNKDDANYYLILGSISNTYIRLGDYNKALSYYEESSRFINDSDSQGKFFRLNSWLQIAEISYRMKNYANAMKYIDMLLAAEKSKVEAYKPWTNPLLARIYANAPVHILLAAGINPAEKNLKAISLLEESVKNPQLSFRLIELRDNYYDLNILYEKEKDFNNAFNAYKKFTLYRDSLVNMGKSNEFVRKEARFIYAKKEDSLKYVQQLMSANLMQQTLLAKQNSQQLLLNQSLLNVANKEKDLQRFAYLKSQAELQSELSLRKANQKQLALANKEKDLQRTEVLLQRLELKARKSQSLYFILGLSGLTLLSFVIGRNYIVQRRSNKVIISEKQRSDDLLLNILPADIAEELKEKGKANARLFDEVTVLFTDFVNFTKMTETLSPNDLVQELHHCFEAFDGIITKYNIEKIKTIGDAYLAVSGLPKTHGKHAHNAVLAAIEIRGFVQKRRLENPEKTFDIRIGVHSGSVVAGIVGVKKFAFDIWGDTVNTAARMEQNSETGKINISETTYTLVKDAFNCSYRGEINAKNKGNLKMYYVDDEISQVVN